MTRRIAQFVVWTLSLAIFAAPSASGADKSVSHRFKFTIVSNLDMEVMGRKQKVTSDTVLEYEWAQNGPERVLRIRSFLVKAANNGKPLMDTFMSRKKYVETANGETNVILL